MNFEYKGISQPGHRILRVLPDLESGRKTPGPDFDFEPASSGLPFPEYGQVILMHHEPRSNSESPQATSQFYYSTLAKHYNWIHLLNALKEGEDLATLRHDTEDAVSVRWDSLYPKIKSGLSRKLTSARSFDRRVVLSGRPYWANITLSQRRKVYREELKPETPDESADTLCIRFYPVESFNSGKALPQCLAEFRLHGFSSNHGIPQPEETGIHPRSDYPLVQNPTPAKPHHAGFQSVNLEISHVPQIARIRDLEPLVTLLFDRALLMHEVEPPRKNR